MNEQLQKDIQKERDLVAQSDLEKEELTEILTLAQRRLEELKATQLVHFSFF